MKKESTTTKAKIGVGQQRIKFVAKELRNSMGRCLNG